MRPLRLPTSADPRFRQNPPLSEISPIVTAAAPLAATDPLIAPVEARSRSSREEAIWLVPVACMALGLVATAQAVGWAHGLSPWSMLTLYGYKALRALPALLGLAAVVQILIAIREQPGAPLARFAERIRRLFDDPWRVAAAVLPLLLMPLVFVGFSSLKMLMPRFIPFWLDDGFAAIDRMIFLGHQPWQLTHALFGSQPATIFIDRLYGIWVFLLSIAIGGFALFAPRTERARFFMSFTLAWVILGVGGAWLLASAGPCYAKLIGAASASEFSGLMERLVSLSRATDGRINAPGWQEALWRSHSQQVYAFGMGISAMPSLHNAIATLYALAAFRLGRRLGWLMTGYAIVIFVGSVHLGWHYAIDGVVAAAAMILIWRWVDRWCRRSGYDAAVALSRDRQAPAAT
jgi:hypothetical protein